VAGAAGDEDEATVSRVVIVVVVILVVVEVKVVVVTVVVAIIAVCTTGAGDADEATTGMTGDGDPGTLDATDSMRPPTQRVKSIATVLSSPACIIDEVSDLAELGVLGMAPTVDELGVRARGEGATNPVMVVCFAGVARALEDDCNGC
jgi:hypothetical protein